jgi:hypothetical protein
MPFAFSTAAAQAGADQAVAGLHMGHDQARLVVLARVGRSWRLEQCQQWPLEPGWLQGGRISDFLPLADTLQQQLAETGIERLAMALPAEACASAVLEPPTGLSRLRPRLWLQQQAAALLQRPPPELTWSAHALPGRPLRWRLVCAPLDLVQDWMGLAEAAQCELVRLDEVHQASWQSLARWYGDAPESTLLLQVGAASVQALHWRGDQWHWLWREQADAQRVLEHCLRAASGASPLALIGESPLAQDLRAQFNADGRSVLRPLPTQSPSWAAGGPLDRLDDGFWPALGLACPPHLA